MPRLHHVAVLELDLELDSSTSLEDLREWLQATPFKGNAEALEPAARVVILQRTSREGISQVSSWSLARVTPADEDHVLLTLGSAYPAVYGLDVALEEFEEPTWRESLTLVHVSDDHRDKAVRRYKEQCRADWERRRRHLAEGVPLS